MRTPTEIEAKLESKEHALNRAILREYQNATVQQLATGLTKAYEDAFLAALSHRPNGELVDKFATFTWLAGSDLNVADVPWLQFGMPRIRRMAKELKLPFIPIGNSSNILLRAKRMSNGLPCMEKCVRCFGGK